MKVSAIKDKNFNFTLSYSDEYLIFKDLSEWLTPDRYEKLDIFDLYISLYDNPDNEILIKTNVNSDTYIPYTKLPVDKTNKSDFCYDGVYKFRIDILGKELFRYEPILENITCAYSKLVISEDFDKAFKVMSEMEYIKSATRNGLFEQASTHYKNLVYYINKINCSCKH